MITATDPALQTALICTKTDTPNSIAASAGHNLNNKLFRELLCSVADSKICGHK